MIKNMRKPVGGQFPPMLESLNREKKAAPMTKNISYSQDYTQEIRNAHKNSKNSAILFAHSQYPFSESMKQPLKLLKTIVSANISQGKMQKITKIHHPNIINIQRITRGHAKTERNGQNDVFYSFYYQSVPYSIKKVVLSNDNQSGLFFQLAPIKLGKVLRNVSDYLMKEGIYNIFRLEDIGVTRSAEIKVYISPLLMCGPSAKIVNLKAVINSIDKLAGWWQTSVASNEIMNPINSFKVPQLRHLDIDEQKSISFQQKSDKSIQIHEKAHGVAQNIGQVKTRLLENRPLEMKQGQIKSCNNSYSSQMSLINTNQLQKMKKIDQQIKFIRERLKEKAMKRKHNESDNEINRSKDYTNKRKKSSGIFEREQMETKREEVSKNADRRRLSKAYNNNEAVQHINCINIYNNQPAQIPSPPTPFQADNKQQLYTFTVTSNTPIEPHGVPPTYNKNLPSFSPDDFPEGEDSVDTYQMQLNPRFEQIYGQEENYQKTVDNNERELSEHRFKPKDSNKKVDGKGSNQVINKNTHQSAGPLQFKNFINKFIKPQFLAKGSNIYEDPGEYDSEQSKSVSKKFRNHYADLLEAGKSATSKTQKTNSHHHNDNMNEPAFQAIRANTLPKQQFKVKTEGVEANKYQQVANNKKGKAMTKHKAAQQVLIGRIKSVLEKTKQAIAQLNRAKAGHYSLPK